MPTHDKPSLACLASRIPYNSKVTKDKLRIIEKAEGYCEKLGLKQLRVRHYDHLCRIEVDEKDFGRVLANKARIIEKFKKLGYNYITLDLEGYRTGSMNEVLK